MSSFDDCSPEMPVPRPLDDAAADLLVAGRMSADPDLALVAAFVADVRAEAARPAPAPSPALAAVLSSGLPAHQLDAAPAAAASREPALPASASRRDRRRSPGWAARLAAASVFTKSALGVSMAAASVTGAAVAGVPVARDVVEAVSPVEFGDRGGERARPAGTQPPRSGVDGAGAEGSGSSLPGTLDPGGVPVPQPGAAVPAPVAPRPPAAVPPGKGPATGARPVEQRPSDAPATPGPAAGPGAGQAPAGDVGGRPPGATATPTTTTPPATAAPPTDGERPETAPRAAADAGPDEQGTPPSPAGTP